MGTVEQLHIVPSPRIELRHRCGEIRVFPDTWLRVRDERLLNRIQSVESRDRSPRGMELELATEGPMLDSWLEHEIKLIVNARGIGKAMGFISERLDQGYDPDRCFFRVLLCPVEGEYLLHIPELDHIAFIANRKRLRKFPLLPLRT